MNPSTAKKLDGRLWRVGAAAARCLSAALGWRSPESRPLILRPGGMGDLILLCVACEEMGCSPRDFFWLIERRSSAWAKHLGLDHLCYDEDLLGAHCRVAGRFPLVVNSEQLFGLSQSTALLARGRGGRLACFDTNRGAGWADVRVGYDPDQGHESVEFSKLLGAALRLRAECFSLPRVRRRKAAPARAPIVGIGGLQSESRALSHEQWYEIIRNWSRGRDFFIASSENDVAFARELWARFGPSAKIFEGTFSSMCDYVAECEEVLTVDSGFVHIASYYGVPVTAVFTSGRDKKWGPLSAGSRIIRRTDLACQPCAWFGQVPPCPHQFRCKDVEYGRHTRELNVYSESTPMATRPDAAAGLDGEGEDHA